MTKPLATTSTAAGHHHTEHGMHFDVDAHFNGDVNAALQAAKAAGGGTVYFHKGPYTCNNITVTDANHITMRGEAGAVLTSVGGANPPLFEFDRCDDLRIEGLSFNANGTTTFGGTKFYDCSRVWVVNNHYYDSNPQPSIGSDLYSFVFTKNTDNNTDIHIVGNVIEDLQVELDHCAGATIAYNKVYRSDSTAGIGVFSTATGTPTVSDYNIHDNYIVDAHGSAGGICVTVDPVATDNCTFQRMDIHDNIILYTGASTPKTGILIGTANNSQATTGNVFSDIYVNNNTLIYAGGSFSDSGILFNSSVTSNFVFNRCTVNQNRLYGTGAGNGIDVRIFQNSAALGNLVKNFGTTINHPSDTNSSTDDIDSSGNRRFPGIYVDGTLVFGTAGDTNLYRSAANKLKTDDVVLIPGDGGTLGALQVGGWVSAGGASSTGLGVFGNSEFAADVSINGILKLSTGTNVLMNELSGDPAAPSANQVRVYAKDNGGGKTGLYARFNTGAVQQIALEP